MINLKSRKIHLLVTVPLVALAGSVWFVQMLTGLVTLEERERGLISMNLTAKDLFVQGEYYFNHDDDPAGPYDLVTARQYYEAAIRKDPEANPLAWYQLGRIDFIEGKFNAALSKFDKQIEYFDDEVLAVHYMIGLTYGYKARRTNDPSDWEEGAAAFETHIIHVPTAPWPRVDLAWIYFAQGKYEEMKPVLKEGLKHYPENAWLLNMYGLALLNTDEKDEALQIFTQAAFAADKLTAQDWGNAYPGNNPATWEQGLGEFRGAISKNIDLARQ